MYCIDFARCTKSADNGNCSAFSAQGVVSHNKGRVCGFVSAISFDNIVVPSKKKVNALKASKRAAAGK